MRSTYTQVYTATPDTGKLLLLWQREPVMNGKESVSSALSPDDKEWVASLKAGPCSAALWEFKRTDG